MVSEYKLLINGALVAGEAGSFQVVNPATGQPIPSPVPHASSAQVDSAVKAARAAFLTFVRAEGVLAPRTRSLEAACKRAGGAAFPRAGQADEQRSFGGWKCFGIF